MSPALKCQQHYSLNMCVVSRGLLAHELLVVAACSIVGVMTGHSVL